MGVMDKNWQEVLDKNRAVHLLDLYGSLLTERAEETLSLYLNEDWSISEIASNLAISRQAVHDSLQRSLEHLERFEEKLGVNQTRALLARELAKLRQLLSEGKLEESLAVLTQLDKEL